ncbi:MAG: Asp-tRNA(Asn)/Glu-tRNA(Gln) amidotransferase GatCAB subunit B, partial [Cyclobacteriaceae bacterium]|nr:Asp-tRNA(Asn)/Glu-tRNA(Gln) amidotransferase GatCAB subunit B [Cyclobacteriaceae bacterium]
GTYKIVLNDLSIDIKQFPINTDKIAKIIELVDGNQLSFSVASQKLFTAMLENPDGEPLQVAEKMNLVQDSDTSTIAPIIDEVLSNYPEKVKEFKKGKKGLLGMFVGEVMKLSNGKADPKVTNQLLRKKLEQ